MKIYIHNFDEGLHSIAEEVKPEDLKVDEYCTFKGPVSLQADIDKFENSFRFKIRLKGTQLVQCDRCLTEYEDRFDESIEQIYQLGSGQFDDVDDVVVLSGDTQEIDIGDLVITLIEVNKPLKNLCKKACKGLCPHCGVNLNNEQCECSIENIDPRLEKLKNFLK